jgi:hypothetical protein
MGENSKIDWRGRALWFFVFGGTWLLMTQWQGLLIFLKGMAGAVLGIAIFEAAVWLIKKGINSWARIAK